MYTHPTPPSLGSISANAPQPTAGKMAERSKAPGSGPPEFRIQSQSVSWSEKSGASSNLALVRFLLVISVFQSRRGVFFSARGDDISANKILRVGFDFAGCLWVYLQGLVGPGHVKQKGQKHTTPRIRWSSPTQLLVWPSLAYLWESGRDPEFSSGYGRM
jgi:hypothetical protein